MPDTRHATSHPEPVRSLMDGPLDDESRLSSEVTIRPGSRYGFFTDTTVCIGCKACEVACKSWNALPAEREDMTGHSYDNTSALSSTTWRHVMFVERVGSEPVSENGDPEMPHFQNRWLMASDVCKHCANAPCLEACPTGSLFRTEFDTVVVQPDICNGCGYCVPACPFGVVDLSPDDGKAHKCTMCYDRLKSGMEPACSKACPTESIIFGEIGDLHARAHQRVERLHQAGLAEAYLYGAPSQQAGTENPATGGDGRGLGGLNAFFLLTAPPETYNLPSAPVRAAPRIAGGLLVGVATATALAIAALGVLFYG